MSPYTHNVLWTAGWDSTFRVVDLLANHGSRVQPWYVIDPDRRSRHIEIETMDRIRSRINASYPVAGRNLLKTKYVHRRDIGAVPEISAAFRKLRQERKWGPQYEWLARLAHSENIRLELGIKSDDRAVQWLSEYLRTDEVTGEHFIAPPLGHPAQKIFSGFTLPLAHVTKLGMKERADRDGFLEVLNMTWFCQHPTLRGSACGLCAPCRHYREEGLGDRLPMSLGLGEHLEFHIVNKSWGVFIRLRGRYRKLIDRYAQ